MVKRTMGKHSRLAVGNISAPATGPAVTRVSMAVAAILAACQTHAAELPKPCFATNCGKGPSTWVTSGAATASVTTDTLRVTQTTNQAVLNWASFNVSADGHVIFDQPSSSALAINKIYQESPSSIFGRIDANGQIYLINPNGFIFGKTASVNAAGILASTLSLTNEAETGGLLAPGHAGRPALASDDGRINVLDANGNLVRGTIDSSGHVVLDPNGPPIKVRLDVQAGAQLASTADGGRVLLAAQEVHNAGTVASSNGQVLLAAGQKVYLQASTNPSLRGLLIEVDAGGKAWNDLTGQLQAPHGNVTMIGLAVNQDGRISASTTVSANGSVRLLARDTIKDLGSGSSGDELLAATHSGTVTLGSQSAISITPDLEDKHTAVDEQKQMPSSVEIMGQQVTLQSGAQIVAPGGTLNVTAITDPSTIGKATSQDPNARIRVNKGVNIDLAGTSVTLPMSRNLVSVDLRANEFRDSPDQRDGALRGKTVVVDARVGTPLGDVSGAIKAIPKSVAERMTGGGSATFNSQGDVVVASGAKIDISGGHIDYQGGAIATSRVVTSDGKVLDISQADPSRTYVALLNPSVTVKHDRWGVVETVLAPGIGRFEPGYVQGMSAGTLQFAAPQMVLNGSFVGNVVNGPYQRDPGSTTFASGGRLILGLPDKSALQISTSQLDYRAPSIEFTRTTPQISVADDAPLPGQAPLLLPTDYFVNGGFTSTEIYSNATVTVPDSTPLTFAPGSSLRIEAGRVQVFGNITSRGGSVVLDSVTAGLPGGTPVRPGVQVGAGVSIDVRGTWTNDTLTDPSTRPLGALYKNGGSIELSAGAPRVGNEPVNNELIIGAGAQFHASGGAWLQTSGQLSAGSGGKISLLAGGQNAVFDVGAGVSLDAFGVAGASGGSFALSAYRVQVANGEQWSAAQKFDPKSSDAKFFTVGSSLFQKYGFSNFDLSATGPMLGNGSTDALRVAAGTNVSARVDVLQLDPGAVSRQSGSGIEGFSRAVTVPVASRTPTSVVLRVAPNIDNFSNDKTALGAISVEHGAVLTADPKSTFSFSSPGGVTVHGTIRAASGSIALQTSAPPSEDFDFGYRPGLALTLASDSILDVSGTAVLTPNDQGLLRGEVLAGGSISLAADRGSIDMQTGSLVQASGTSAPLDLANAHSASGYSRETVASAGGSISLSAAEGITFGGAIRATAGQGTANLPNAGSLSVRLTQGNVKPRSTTEGTYPAGSRIIRLVSGAVAANEPTAQNGLVVVTTDMVAASGVDSLTLQTDDTQINNPHANNRIEIGSGVQLALGRQLQLSAPVLAMSAGGTATLSAAAVTLGNSSVGQPPPAPTTGSGILNVSADFIELIGSSSLQGVGAAHLRSGGDLRLRGVQVTGAPVGSFAIAGDLTLAAARIYPGTASSFTVDLGAAPNGTLRIEQTGGSPGTPLSAAGQVTLLASNIVQGGTLLAPFGSINLKATNSLTLADGSLTSVSGNGALVPFGQTQLNGAQWVYQFAAAAQQTSIPARNVTLDGTSVAIAKGAVVDLSGGGDLYAYEFQPGSGGSNDALAAGQISGLYAVLPSLKGQYAPYDPQEFANSTLKTGDSVYLSGGGGLAAGFYPLLPARYALLPGAFLVKAVSGFTDLAPGSVGSLSNGTPVVAGYRAFASTGLGDGRYTGFAVYPGSYGRALASYADSLASTFFPSQANRLGLPRAAQPADAGQLSLIARSTLDAQGSVRSLAATGGLGAKIELAATRLEVTGAATPAAADGTVRISASVLDQWHPGQLLLGGQSSPAGDSITVASDSVSIKQQAQLSFDQITIVARDGITVEAGSRVASNSAGSSSAPKLPEVSNVQLTGDKASGAAYLAMSDLTQALPTRPTASAGSSGGRIDIATGAQLATRGSIVLDAPSAVNLQGNVAAAGAHWSLGSGSITFGADPGTGLAISSGLLTALNSASSVRLASSGWIDFASPVTLGAVTGSSSFSLDELTLVASGLRNSNPTRNAGTTLLGARKVSLVGLSTSQQTNVGSGSLSIVSDNLSIGSGQFAVSGFARTSLTASGDISGKGVGTTLTVGGALDLNAARLTVAHGADLTISSNDLVKIGQTGSVAGLPAPELGGALTIQGSSIQDDGSIIAPSGLVTLRATKDLSLSSRAVIDVAGRRVTAAERTVNSSGGSISLLAGGDLTAAGGSVLNVSGIGTSDAGALSVRTDGNLSLAGDLLGQPGAGGTGGAFQASAQKLADFGSLAAKLQTGGFSERQSIHVASGDLDLAAGAGMTARIIELATDTGAIHIAGTLSAASATKHSTIRINGGQGVQLQATAQVHADAANSTARGGSIELGSSGGNIQLDAGSVITAAGGTTSSDGELRLRARALTDDIAISSLAGQVSRVGSFVVEPILVTDLPTASPGGADLDLIRSNASTYLAAASGKILSRLSRGDLPPILIQPGIELHRAGDLNLGSLDLSSWRFNGQPAALTVRATGSINVAGTISDGFSGTSADNTLALLPSASAPIRLIAGADLSSADPRGISNAMSADITLNSGSVVRTGTGELLLRASRNIVFQDSSAQVYTGGIPGVKTQVIPRGNGASLAFPTSGGDLSLIAGQDIVGAPVTQSVSAWQRRTFTRGISGPLSASQWGVDLSQFGWNSGTLGGGDLTASAGRDIINLSAAAADSASASGKDLVYFGGGSLTETAGRNFGSGMLFVAHGQGSVRADGALISTRLGLSNESLGTLVALDDARIDIRARGDVLIETALNPTVLYQAPPAVGRTSHFFTYTDKSALNVESVAGRIAFGGGATGLRAFLGADFDKNSPRGGLEAYILPPSVTLRALSSDITLAGTALLFPTDTGQLDLFAARDIQMTAGDRWAMSDAADVSVPTVAHALVRPPEVLAVSNDLAAVGSARHVADRTPVFISAGRDINDLSLSMAKSVRLSAGRDINNLNLDAQNLNQTDVTLVSAVRDFTYSTNATTAGVRVGGPGRFDLIAGRQVDLGFSKGLTTDGALRNPAIPDTTGAALTVFAGLGRPLDLGSFIDKIVAPSSDYQTQLIQFVADQLGQPAGTFAAAKQAFASKLDASFQRKFVLDVFFAELVKSGKEANSDPKTAFKRGYAAVDALFPGSRSPTSANPNPYSGDVSLLLSRLYTLSGGDISVLAPGGLVNVGLAVPPSGPNVPKRQPSDLGIVAQGTGSVRVFTDGDVLVNSSRIFTLGGGNIAIWSTHGNVDAGRGAKSAISAPPPQVLVSPDGTVTLNFQGAVTGSGIRTIAVSDTTPLGDVDLIAPVGFINAGDAGIGASGNANLAGKKIIGADNIQVGGTATGVPPATGGLGLSLSGASTAGSSASSASTSASATESAKQAPAPLAQSALSWLDVFIEGFGEEVCKPSDTECLQRNQKK